MQKNWLMHESDYLLERLPPTVAEAMSVLDDRDAIAWAATMGSDFRRAWDECPTSSWALGFVLSRVRWSLDLGGSAG